MNVFFGVQGTLPAGSVPRPQVREAFTRPDTRGHYVHPWPSAGAGYATGAARFLDPEEPDFAQHQGGDVVLPFRGDSEDQELWKVQEEIRAASV